MVFESAFGHCWEQPGSGFAQLSWVQMFSGGPDAQENLLGLCCSHHKSVSRLWAELWARFAC